ncbi:MAG: hypothetical protein ACKO96_12205, partial [Flammeovirgaceae bacterium]
LIADRMLKMDIYGDYENAPLIGRIGQAFFESQTSAETTERYWKNAICWVRMMREVCQPYLTPIDKLRLEMDEVWPMGSSLGSLEGRRMFAGLARVFKEGAYAEAHQDVLSWDTPESISAKKISGQIAANTYLKMPKHGGELKLWRVELSREEYEKIKIKDSYGLDLDAKN